MDPNSQHQLWSRWTVIVTPPKNRTRWGGFDARLWAATVRRLFRTTAGEVKLDTRGGGMFSLRPRQYVACARLEGVPAHDPDYRKALEAELLRFFGRGFGNGTTVHVDVHIEAGDRQDGKPPSQLVMLPTLTSEAPHALVPMP